LISNNDNETFCSSSQSLPSSCNGWNKRIVTIGDVHGTDKGLREVLYEAKITKSIDSCEWRDNNEDYETVLIQVGDIVDRGAGALEAWECLDNLQNTAKSGKEKVIRLIGNHELWWLTGTFHQRNNKGDTKAKMLKLVSSLKSGIVNGNIVGSHLENIDGVEVLFIHAGFRQKYLDHLGKSKYFLEKYPEGVTPSTLVDFVNNEVIKIVDNKQCQNSFLPSKCYFDGGSDGQLYEAGKERGGRNIGGPFWTDYSIIENDAMKGPFKPEMIQIVGNIKTLNNNNNTNNTNNTNNNNNNNNRAFNGILLRSS
jgi:hypothetical protein